MMLNLKIKVPKLHFEGKKSYEAKNWVILDDATISHMYQERYQKFIENIYLQIEPRSSYEIKNGLVLEWPKIMSIYQVLRSY